MDNNSSGSALRRLGVLANQLGNATSEQIDRQQTSGASTSYASIDGRPSSYARIHGTVSRSPAAWRRVPVVAKEELREVLYDKAEGIAKAGDMHGALSAT